MGSLLSSLKEDLSLEPILGEVVVLFLCHTVKMPVSGGKIPMSNRGRGTLLACCIICI